MFYELLEKGIKQRCTLYGISNLDDLNTFLIGYSIPMDYYNILDKEYEDFFKNFSDWLKKTKKYDTSRSWIFAIKTQSNDPSTALTLFFELFVEFKNRNI